MEDREERMVVLGESYHPVSDSNTGLTATSTQTTDAYYNLDNRNCPPFTTILYTTGLGSEDRHQSSFIERIHGHKEIAEEAGPAWL